MTKIRNLLKLMRPHQWYKNLVIFLPFIFGGVLFDLTSFAKTLLGLMSLCFISSTNYIINDIIDRNRDKNHPEKRNRPIASKKIKVWEALIFALILLTISVTIAAYLNRYFLLSILAIFLLTQAYTFHLKKEIFVDIILIALNFVIRTVSGAFIVDVKISSWLILCPFFLSLFISVGKRESDLIFLGKKAKYHREVLNYYSTALTNTLMIITTTSLVIAYSLYSFLSVYKDLLLTLPIALYAIFRYLYLIYQGSIVTRHPEKFFKDKRLAVSTVLWVIAVIILIYVV